MSAGNWIAAILAAFTAIGAAVAFAQARTARTAARAADAQAACAREQVEIMKQQLTYAAANRDKADAPAFVVQSAAIETDSHGEFQAVIELAQVGGVALDEVEVAASGTYVRGVVVDQHAVEGRYAAATSLGKSGPGAVMELPVGIEYRHVTPVNVVLDFKCIEAGTGKRTWTSRTAARADHPPPSAPKHWRQRFQTD